MFHIENEENAVVALVSSFYDPAFASSVLTISSSYSSSVSISVEESNSFVLTILDLSQQTN